MLVLLFSLTSFVSAFLLFWVQPLIAKLLLPLLGGTPAVWNTAMMFFQLMLLAGYIYAHPAQPAEAMGTMCAARRRAAGSGGLAAVWRYRRIAAPTGGQPIFWLLGALASLVGLPFRAVGLGPAAWRLVPGRNLRRDAGDPYFLYAASNTGQPGLAARLSRRAGAAVAATRAGATLGRLGLILLFVLCGANLRWSGAAPQPATEPAELATADRPGWRQRVLWVALAFVPSSLLLGVTSYVSTRSRLGALLWVVPLALYL